MLKPVRNNLVIELHIPNFQVAKQFYTKLEFELLGEDPIGEELGYMVMIRKDPLGDTSLNFYGGDERVINHSFFKDFPEETKRGYEVEITIPVKNIGAFYEKVFPQIKGNIVQELALKRFGKKDFRVVDPFGFYLRFTELVDWWQK